MAEKEDEAQGAALIQINATATDVLGLGAAAKTPAANSLVKAMSGAIANWISSRTTVRYGDELTRIEANRIMLLADARAKAGLIEGQYEDGHRIRTGIRVLGEEMRAQHYIEDATRDAVRIANNRDPLEPVKEPSRAKNSFCRGSTG